MLLNLLPHPANPPVTVSAIQVELRAREDEHRLTYLVTHSDTLLLPHCSTARRADGLWKTTCFELFAAAEGTEGYVEFNFSPSSEWAAYRFSDFRQGMRNLELEVPPFITDSRTADIDLPEATIDAGQARFALEVDLDLTSLSPGAMKIGLSAIIEEAGGIKSYWALAHPPTEPDFHHPACFAIELPAAKRA